MLVRRVVFGVLPLVLLPLVTSAASADDHTQSTPRSPGAGGMVDVWDADPELKLFKRLRERAADDGQPVLDILGLGDGDRADLEAMWADPEIAFHILKNFPMFHAFEGVAALADKAREDFTPEDGLQALEAFRRFSERAVQRLVEVGDPTKLAEKMQGYAELIESDGALREMAARVEAGDKAAAFELHDRVAQDVWGGTVDLRHFGLDGQEPAGTAALRKLVRESEPALWRMLTQDDPLITQLMEDPTWITQLANGLEDKAGY